MRSKFIDILFYEMDKAMMSHMKNPEYLVYYDESSVCIFDKEWYETRHDIWDESNIRLFTCDECCWRHQSEQEKYLVWQNKIRGCWLQYDRYNKHGDCLMEK